MVWPVTAYAAEQQDFLGVETRIIQGLSFEARDNN